MNLLALPDGREIPLEIRRSSRARRILLHVGSHSGKVELVLPRWAPRQEAIEFAESKVHWVKARLDEIPLPVPFVHGSVFPLLGAPIEICHVDAPRSGIWLRDDRLEVSCDPAALAGRVQRWLRQQATDAIRVRADEKAARLGARYRRISVRDPRTRWGSCSPQGDLSFSWRLVLAPESVLDYVVGHEVAHLEEMSHSRRFWAAVDRLCNDVEASREWLRRRGAELHRYGRAPGDDS